jgi:hypothetical protein
MVAAGASARNIAAQPHRGNGGRRVNQHDEHICGLRENKPGVLARVVSPRRCAFNIDSLPLVAPKPEVSRMTITAEADRDQARRIEANLLSWLTFCWSRTFQPAARFSHDHGCHARSTFLIVLSWRAFSAPGRRRRPDS